MNQGFAPAFSASTLKLSPQKLALSNLFRQMRSEILPLPLRNEEAGQKCLDFGITVVILFVMKTAISIPDVLFAAVERLARQLGISRSELFARAMKAFLAKNSEVGVTEKLNAVYGNEESELDPTLQTMQFQSIGEDSW
jgi:hypothetical protein